MISIGGNSLAQYGLPEPDEQDDCDNIEFPAENHYDPLELIETLRDGVPKLTAEQREIFERGFQSVNIDLGEICFLDAPGGTGKTFLTKIILAKLRYEKKMR